MPRGAPVSGAVREECPGPPRGRPEAQPVTPNERPRRPLATASASLAPGLGNGIRPSNDSRQLKDLSLQVLYLRSQKQILPIRHRQNGI